MSAAATADAAEPIPSAAPPLSPAPSAAGEDGLVPVRALNQLTYCPRLYWLQYVEAVVPVNEHLEDGRLLHRRVDDPGLEFRRRREDGVPVTRSVSLSSPALGLSGKLDVVEEEGGGVRPVEYKRSAVPTGADGRPTWRDNDAVQVAAQAMLLEEEFGRAVPSGVLYYAGSRARVEVPVDNALRERVRAAVAEARALSASQRPPDPLPSELRHKCRGCSLVGICQPEETLFLSSAETEAGDGRRDGEGGDGGPSGGEHPGPSPAPFDRPVPRVLPSSHEGAVLYVQEQGAYVGRRSEHLVVRIDGAEVRRVPIATVRQVVVFGNVQVSTEALTTLAAAEVPVAFLSAHGRFLAAVEPAPAKNVSLRTIQHRAFADPAKAMELSKAVVRAKIANQRTLLMRTLRARRGDATDAGDGGAPTPAEGGPAGAGGRGEAVRFRASDDPAAREMADMAARVASAGDAATLLGLEGQAAAAYFSAFGRMLAPRPGLAGFDFASRNRRPPRDPVNAVLSFAYAMLAKDCFSAVTAVGFDPYLGFYHAGRHGRPSLALDVMEEFRSVISDSVTLTLFNNGLLGPRDFVSWRSACQLAESGRRRFFEAYHARLADEVTHPLFGYRMAWSRMIEVQARLLAAHLRGEHASYVGFTVR
jgi:CRISPR-associated protein Cas1